MNEILNEKMMKSILLVDDHEIVRDSIKLQFEGDKDFYIADEAANGYDALQLMLNDSYDIVILDINMPKMNGIELMEKIRINYPDQKVLVLTMLGDAKLIKKMLDLGAQGYLLKTTPSHKIKAALKKILDGENYFDEKGIL